MFFTSATAPGKSGVPNEDWVAATSDLIVVLDGATIRTDTGCHHGVPWYTRKLGAGIIAGAASRAQTLTGALADAITVKADWGHSSNIVGVELCQAARAKRLILFHHEPSCDDRRIVQTLEETRRFEKITREDHVLEVLSAWDGLELTL